MAIDFLCDLNIEPGIEIACHPEATHYSCRSRRIKFFRVNPHPGKKMKEIPKGTNTICIREYREHWREGIRDGRGWINYGITEFISHRGNILKAEEYS
jgi:hypothetical protein